MKTYTIVRHRNVSQIMSDQVEANSEAEALEIANENPEDHDGMNEWHSCGDPEYPVLTSDDILEVKENEEVLG